MKTKRLSCKDRNIFGLVDGRVLDAQQVPYPYQEHNPMRALQMHSAFVSRLHHEKPLEGHLGCVNALAWNSTGSWLLSGSDDTRVNVWEYSTRKLVHSVDTGHTANIFCTKFLPESRDDVVVSGAGDSEVRMHSLSRSSANAEPLALFRCHAKRVKKLAVEEGNPHTIWSASEDGTLRQHDLRQAVTCGPSDQECRNVLLDLRNASKRSLSEAPKGTLALKTCAINPTRPYQLLIGGSDAFARLYDRRMLSPLSSSHLLSRSHCVCYYCPMHLSENARSGLHLTHVTFSPDGQEVLLSYSGEHVYLMDVYTGKSDTLVYTATDVPKRTSLVPIVNGSQLREPTQEALIDRVSLQECKELLHEARMAIEEGNFFSAIELTSEVIDAGAKLSGARIRHDCLCVRASALLKREWKNDAHMAIRDSNEARLIDPMSVTAHHQMAEALSQLGRHKEALEFATRASHLDPTSTALADHVSQIRAKLAAAEEARKSKNNETEAKSERRSRIRSLREFFFRTEHDHNEYSSDDSRRAERDDSDNDDDVEMEMEIEMSVTDDPDRTEAGVPASSSLNLRVRRKNDTALDKLSSSSESLPSQPEIAMDMLQRYVGHCNTGTDIKQASFLGERGEFVASGSDDGRWFIWEKKTGKLVNILEGDDNVVNCIQCHPFDCAVATSGIDNTIKMWTPCSDTGARRRISESEALCIIAENQQQMRRHRELGLPLEFLQRIRGIEGAVHPFECTQS